MVYASKETLSWKPIVTSWLKDIPETLVNAKNKDLLNQLFNTHIDNTI